jgi:type II secretory pathway component PulM
MNDILNKLTEKQKIFIYIAIAFVVVAIFFKILIYPIFAKSDNLEKQLIQQQSLNEYLLDSQKLLINNKIFPKLNGKSAIKVIDRVFSGMNKKNHIKDDSIVFNAKNQNFSKILTNIHSLKENHGIVATKAKFTKTKEGLVDADITFKFP